MTGPDTHMLPAALACLECGHKVNAVGSPDGSPIGAPNPGDVTACMYCGAVMIFGDDGKLRGFTDAEADELMAERETMATLAGAIRRIHLLRHTLS